MGVPCVPILEIWGCKRSVATAAESSAEITRVLVAWDLAASGTARQRNGLISAGVMGGEGD